MVLESTKYTFKIYKIQKNSRFLGYEIHALYVYFIIDICFYTELYLYIM